MKLNTNLELPENASLEFTSKGLYLKVCLPIPKEVVKYIGNENNKFKCKNKKVNYYKIRELVDNPSKKRIEYIYKQLVTKLQINIRERKILVIEEQISNLNLKM